MLAVHFTDPKGLPDSYEGNLTMSCSDKQQIVCNGEFKALHSKLDKMDESIRGNGKPGIMIRLDRLERAQALRSRLFWIAVGIVSTVLAKIGISICL